MCVEEEEKIKKGSKPLFKEMMAEKFSNLRKETHSQIQNPRVLNKINIKRSTPRHIKLLKVKHKKKS